MMLHLHDLLPMYLIRPIAWALVHSIWQIAVLAVAFQALALLTRPSSARLRYFLGCATLLAAVTVPLFTAAHLARVPEPAADHGNVNQGATRAGTTPISPPSPTKAADGSRPASATTLLARTAVAIDSMVGWVVALWLTGVALAFAQLAVARRRAQFLVQSAGRPAPAEHRELLARLARRLGVRHRVRLRRSRLIDAPSLIGWLHPTILLPESAATLTALELEPLVAHELAHVRRHDYAANLVQALIGRLLFFHPGVHWLSRRVRMEREACCDDLAARCCEGGPLAYARALVRFEGLRSRAPALGIADGGLQRRIRRLVQPRELRGRRTLTGTALLVLCLPSIGVSGHLVTRSTTATVIDGLDPVLLVDGRRQHGTPRLAVELDGYRYLFAGVETLDRFMADPERYKVRNVAICPVSGRRVRPEYFRVVDGHIVLFCCDELSPATLARARRALASDHSSN